MNERSFSGQLSMSSRSTYDPTIDPAIVSKSSRINNFNNNQLTNLPASPTNLAPGSPDNFTKELARLQDEQMMILQKIEREQALKEQLEKKYLETRANLRSMMERTRNGNIIKEFDVASRKQLGRMEYQLQTSKTKLSVARNENATLKKRVQDLRRDKMLHLQILNDLMKEMNDGRRKLKFNQKELLTLNEKKHKTKVAIANIKNKMVKEMEDFSKELQAAKKSISNTQNNLLSTVRNQTLEAYSPTKASHFETEHCRTPVGIDCMDQAEVVSNEQKEIQAILDDLGFSGVEDLAQALDRSEEQMFVLYNETQLKEEEMEKMDADNKHLEQQVEQQMSKLHALEGHHDKVKHELEQNIQLLRSQIQRFEGDYNKKLDVLHNVTDNLMNLLRSIAIDEEALDQSLLSSGVTDRNVDDYLSLIEQRIDNLIQMSKAAQHQTIRRDDFMKVASGEKHSIFHAPHLPSLTDGGVNDDDDDALDDNIKLQPISISVLKELMQKKLQAKEKKRRNNRHHNLGVSPSQAGLRSRQASAASLRSQDSAQSLLSQPSK